MPRVTQRPTPVNSIREVCSFSTEFSVLVQSLFFFLHIGKRKTDSEPVQKVQLKRTNLLLECTLLCLALGFQKEKEGLL